MVAFCPSNSDNAMRNIDLLYIYIYIYIYMGMLNAADDMHVCASY